MSESSNVDLDVAEIDITHFKQFLPSSISQFEGAVSYSGQHAIELGHDHVVIDWAKLSLLAENVLVSQGDITTVLARKQFDSRAMKVTLNTGQSAKQPVIIEGVAQVALQDFKVFYQSEEQTLSAFKALTLKDITLAQHDGQRQLDIDSIDLSDAFFSDILKDDIPALAKLSLLGVHQVSLTENGINVWISLHHGF